ncbi:MAG: phosphohydrolase [Deltaproteobacteria bacterium]|nr:phosphohydrolase [Deltaproteobacteria bacterium]
MEKISSIFFAFTFFAILGWIIEVVYRSTRDGRFVNPGLLKGPYLILYGTAALVLMASISLIHEYNFFIKILCYFMITTGLELVSGFNAQYFFNVRLWDYSDQRFQYKGHICLKFSVYWVILAFAFEYLVLPLYQSLISTLPSSAMVGSGALLLTLMILDFAMAVRRKKISGESRGAGEMEKEFLEIAGPVLEYPAVAGLSQYNHHNGKTRLDHVKEVAWVSFIWGKRFSLDCRAIVRGALLHDLFFYDWLREGPRLHGFRHPAIAHRNARKIATLSKKEEDIIKKHMWPLTLLPPCYAESFIVCMVDTFCSVRDYMKHHKDDKHGKHIYVGH